MESKVWSKEDVQNLIDTNDLAVIKAILRVYENQTANEKAIGGTVEYNKVGFSGNDGAFLSSLAEFYKKAGFLTAKQISAARPRMKRYWKQLLSYMEKQGYQVVYK